MPNIITGIWVPPGENENQWEVHLGDLSLVVNAKFHQQAKRMAINYWASCCAVPQAFKKSINNRIESKWRGGIWAKLRHKGRPSNKPLNSDRGQLPAG